MIVILACDGLEYDYVEKFGLKNLMQKNWGKTDISEFSELRTVVLWASFLTGKNHEKRVLAEKNFWNFKIPSEETFFGFFDEHVAIGIPAYSSQEVNKKERALLKGFFNKEVSIEKYDEFAFSVHRKAREKFFKCIRERPEIIMVYFNLADIIGHLSFGVEVKMKMVYEELDGIVKRVGDSFPNAFIFIISDHGMKAVGRYGDHSKNGFWSMNKDVGLSGPKIKITDFYDVIKNMSKNKV